MVSNPRQPSRRFLSAQEMTRSRPHRALGPGEMFAEGPWQTIRVRLEGEGWTQSQIEHMHDQLRQGWPLGIAKRNVAVLSGHCPRTGWREG
jgi:hypothetical protein